MIIIDRSGPSCPSEPIPLLRQPFEINIQQPLLDILQMLVQPSRLLVKAHDLRIGYAKQVQQDQMLNGGEDRGSRVVTSRSEE